MKRIAETFGLAIIVFLLILELHQTKPFHYFRDEPKELLLVALLTFIGGVGALLYYRSGSAAQRIARLWVWGVLASGFTGMLPYLGWSFASVLPKMNSLEVATAAGVFIALSTSATCLWLEFYRTWRGRP